MTETRKPKKSATLEVRLPQEAKDALMRRCQALGLSASEVVRSEIESFLKRTADFDFSAKDAAMPVKPLFTRARLTAACAIAAGAAAFGIVLISPSMAAPDLRAVFESLDANRDGALSLEEFRARIGEDVVFIAQEGAPPPAGAEPFMVPLGDTAPPRLAGSSAPPAPLAAAEFAHMDGDASGGVSLGEFIQAHNALMRTAFAGLDADGNGALIASELAGRLPDPAQAGALLTQMDVNHDGRASYEEFSATP